MTTPNNQQPTPSILYLVPSFLGDGQTADSLPPLNLEVIRRIKHFIVENEKSARAFLKKCGVMPPFDGITLHHLDKHTTEREKQEILKTLKGNEAGIISEAGCPAVADPGAELIHLAHIQRWIVKPLVGPSSILMALMASGMNGQEFTFHGYLPVTSYDRIEKIKSIEHIATISGYTQIFIETPFRNPDMLADILKTCGPETLLSVACEISLPTEEIYTKTITAWQKKPIELKGRPAVFSIWVDNRKPEKRKYGNK